MKKVGIFILLSVMFISYSCKDCKHKIKTEIGKLTKDSTDIDPINIIVGLKFNNSKAYAFKNADLENYINKNENAEVYRYEANFPANSLGSTHEAIKGWFVEIVNSNRIITSDSNNLIGKYGCIPKFTIVNNHVLRTLDGKVPIIVAVHPDPPSNDPIQPTSDFFPIDNDDYNNLDIKIINEPTLEGGLDEVPTNGKMIIYRNRITKVLCINTDECD